MGGAPRALHARARALRRGRPPRLRLVFSQAGLRQHRDRLHGGQRRQPPAPPRGAHPRPPRLGPLARRSAHRILQGPRLRGQATGPAETLRAALRPRGRCGGPRAGSFRRRHRPRRPQPGETMLDIGCGWGGLSIWAAQHYGVKAHGVTLSRAQAEWAQARIKREGLEGRCVVEHRDLRDIPEGARYDKIAAIGVIEHVGIANYRAFFGRVRDMLNDGGLYLNHGIHHEFHWKHTSQTDFLYRYVFPNGDLSGVTETLTEMERAQWEIVDVENLRLHYARTCRHWVERLEARADEARALVGEQIYRTWRLYLTCSSVAFHGGSIGLWQMLLRKQWDPAGPTEPTTREDI